MSLCVFFCLAFVLAMFSTCSKGLSESKAAGTGGPGEWPPALVKALALMRHLQKENPR